MLAPGQTFAARYRVQRCIAEGGMGAIFEAEHVATERRVALKLLFPHIMSVASARSKFELEAKISARVNSPFIVEVLDAGFDDATQSPFLVMELLDGQTLAERVRTQGPLPADEALRLLEQIAAGLDAAHGYREPGGSAKPIVHRDLKPENLFLARQHDGSVSAKILDYGIAKVLGDTSNLSQVVQGTPLFMSFEQVTAGALSPQTDVWAFGLIAWHMLTGANYWRSPERQGSSVQSLFAEILTLPLEAPSVRLREQNLSIDLPAAFDAWLLRCIDREPSNRFPSAGVAVDELARTFELAPRPSSRPSPQPLVGASGRTQAFVAADVSAGPAPISAAPAPTSGAGSLPAMATTGHRRSLPPRVRPVHWAAAGALGGALLLGMILWLWVGGDPPAATSPVQPSPAQSSPALPSAKHGAASLEPEPASVVPAAPRIRIAPIDEAPPSGERPASARAAGEPVAAQTAEPSAASAAPSRAGSDVVVQAPAAKSPARTGATTRKRPRKPRPGTGEAYDTR